jgi:polysaccharide chain length determinant protein (PEP-CTERM system associated)
MLGHRPLHLEDYYSILKRRGWIVLVPTILVPLIALGMSYFVAPQYLSQTLVLIESQKVPDNYVKPVISSDLDSRLASMKEQILSRSRLQPIIDRYNLYAGRNLDMDDRIALARKNITIKEITSDVAHSSGLPGFFISFKADDPHTAQLVCGEITSLFLGANLRSREAAAEGTTDFLASQLQDAKRNLDEQDAKLAAFQRQYIGRLPSEEQPNMDMLSSLNTQLEAATQSLARMEQDKAYEEAMLSQQSQSTSPALQTSAAIPGSLADQQLQLQNLLNQQAELTAHYTSDYPDVITVRRKIADLRHQIARNEASIKPVAPGSPNPNDSAAVQQLRAQIRASAIGIQAKRQEQTQIQRAIEMYQGRIQSTPLVEEQYKEITRNNQTAQAFYDDLLSKMNQSRMATDLEKREQGEQFHVMDEPNLPDAPVSPKRIVYVFGGLVAGIAFGLLIVAGLEYKDTSLRTEHDIWAFTKLPTLATIAQTAGAHTPPLRKRSILQRLFHRQSQAPAQAEG